MQVPFFIHFSYQYKRLFLITFQQAIAFLTDKMKRQWMTVTYTKVTSCAPCTEVCDYQPPQRHHHLLTDWLSAAAALSTETTGSSRDSNNGATAAGLFNGVLFTGDLGPLMGLFLLCELRLTRPSPDAWRLRLGFSGDLKRSPRCLYLTQCKGFTSWFFINNNRGQRHGNSSIPP